MTATTIRIAIVDDNQSYRKAVHRSLKVKSNFQVVAEAEDGRAAIQAVEKHRPDVVLMDISMPVINGIDATRIITSKFPDTKVIILSAQTDECYLNSAFQAGAFRCLSKTGSLDELLKAIMDCSLDS